MKNTQKGFVVPLLVAVIALLIVGGGLYLYKNRKAEAPVVTTGQDAKTNTPETTTPPGQTTSSDRAIITVLLPKKNDLVNISSPMKVTWQTSSGFTFSQVTIAVVRADDGTTAFKTVTVPNTGSAMITVPSSVGVIPYKILIQGTPYTGRGEAPFTYSDEFFFSGGVHSQMYK